MLVGADGTFACKGILMAPVCRHASRTLLTSGGWRLDSSGESISARGPSAIHHSGRRAIRVPRPEPYNRRFRDRILSFFTFKVAPFFPIFCLIFGKYLETPLVIKSCLIGLSGESKSISTQG